jgi:choline kinase
MTYIILAAGMGTKLHPLTLNCPKAMCNLGDGTTVVNRMVKQIRRNDDDAEIVVVVGFMADSIIDELERENVIFVRNPFYKITKSAASLWFAGEYLNRDNVTILNSDIVLSDRVVEDLVCKTTDKPYVVQHVDSVSEVNYNIQSEGDKVVLLSTKISSASGGYCNIIKLDGITARVMYDALNQLIHEGDYGQHYEDLVTQMIFSDNYEFYVENIANDEWIEIDEIDDIVKAKSMIKASL